MATSPPPIDGRQRPPLRASSRSSATRCSTRSGSPAATSSRRPASSGASRSRRSTPPRSRRSTRADSVVTVRAGMLAPCRWPERSDRADPRLGDRRRRGARRPVRAAAHRLRRRDRVGPRAHVRGGLHPRSGAADVREHPHRGLGDRRRTTALREEARGVIRRAVNGGDDDVVLFCGSGATGAIDKLVRVLGLDRAQRPVVFIGPYEHHSNELPWRESVADVVTIREDADGRVDVEHLGHELRRHADRALKIGSFSAASNVTGIVTDVDEVSAVLHGHGALACFDYAAAGPYLPIDMNPPAPRPASKDAVFISPHKFIGGPGTPGVLVAKRALFRNPVPGSGRRHRHVRHARGHSYHPDPRSARRAARRRSSSRSAPASCSRSRRRSGAMRSAAASMTSRGARSTRGPRTRTSRSSATPTSSGWRSSRSACGIRPPAARELRRRRAQRPLRHPGPQRLLLRRPLSAPPLRDRRGVVAAHGRRDRERAHGREARAHPPQLQLLHQRDGVQLPRRRRPPGRRRGLEAAASLSLRSALRALAAPRRRRAIRR